MTRRALALLPLLWLAGCGGDDEVRPYAVARRADVWQNVVLDRDRSRLAALYQAWRRARADAEAAGGSGDLAALGPLGDSDAAIAWLPLPPGAYRCRVARLGAREGEPPPPLMVAADPWRRCTIAADAALLRLEQDAGTQSFSGTLYPDNDRMVFLGTVRLAGEMGVLRYGTDMMRDQAGVVRRIGDRRWRIELPWPRWQSRLVLIELEPA